MTTKTTNKTTIRRQKPLENLINSKKLAIIFGINEESVSLWKSKGMPLHSVRDGINLYNSPDVISWYLAYKGGNETLNLTVEKAKLTQRQCEMMELQIAEKKKTLVSAEEIIDFWTNLISGVKFNLLDIPKTVSQQFDGITSADELEKMIYDLINSSLNNLSKGFEINVNREVSQSI